MNGTVTAIREDGFDVRVEQSFGNCPQYIQARAPRFTATPASVALLGPFQPKARCCRSVRAH